MPEFEFTLTEEPLEFAPPRWDSAFGAELTFVGVVRGKEQGAPIAGIDYSAYATMVNSSLEGIGEDAASRFGSHRALMVHRTGHVAAAEPSVVLQVGAPHSAEAFEICRWYLEQLKKRVPIWKEIVPAGSTNRHESAQ